MSSSKSGSRKEDGKNKVRNLPSSMSSKKERNISSGQKKTVQFFKLMEGVVVVLSGFVNPERSTLRSQVLEMGAEYKADWSSDCTILVSAFPNTPKFRQVQADSGTIVSKEWISECYKQKKLVEIDPYLMNAGKPWRKANHHHDAQEGQDVLPARPQTKDKGTAHSGTARSPKAKETASSSNAFSSSKVKEWAIKDLSQTISWLESQDEKPEPDEIKKIAAQGIRTCLQDAIEALKQNQAIKDGMSQWMFVPQVVKKLAEIEESTAKDELIKVATHCEQIYAAELEALDEHPMNKRSKPNEESDSGSDSDATIVMTEEEIDLARRSGANS